MTICLEGQQGCAMDAGLAAVLGALAGSVATIGAALATGRAQREGARIAARAEHRRERREPRHGAYKEFIAEATRLNSEVAPFVADLDIEMDITQEMVSRWDAISDAVKEKSTEVVLAGPKSVTELALILEGLASSLHSSLNICFSFRNSEGAELKRIVRLMRGQLVTDSKNFKKSFQEFVFKAQAALDDDGSSN
ncbi:hypothetical protein ACFXMT_03135 [Streptomyces mirabilis]|uniref:hypothetical protein n=1 Tax=Streptomyces mirabilis TaxID=68239 RepID=UPI00367A39ED